MDTRVSLEMAYALPPPSLMTRIPRDWHGFSAEYVELASDAPTGSFLAEQHQVIDRVTMALGSLSAEQQEVVRLSFIHDLPHAEIAARIGIPLGTVKSRLRLAYERLRPMLEDLQ